MNDRAEAANRRVRIGAVLALLVVFAVGGYIWFATSQARTPADTRAKVTFAVVTSPNSALAHVASLEGYFADEGLDVTLQRHTSGKAAVQSLLDGKADLTTLGDIPFMFSVMGGADIRLLATMIASDKNLAIVADRTQGIEGAKDLACKKIGVTLGTGGHFFLSVFLALQGISVNDVEVVDMAPNDLVAALGTGQLDAVSTWQPHGVRAEGRLGDRAIVFTSQGIHRETFNVATRADRIETNPDAVAALMKALHRAEDFIARNPEKAIDHVASVGNQDRESVKKVWESALFNLALEQSLITTLESEGRRAIANKLVDKTDQLNFLNFIYGDALQNAKPEGGKLTIETANAVLDDDASGMGGGDGQS